MNDIRPSSSGTRSSTDEPLVQPAKNPTSKQASFAMNHAQPPSSGTPSTTDVLLIQQVVSPARTQSQLTMSVIQSPSSDASSTSDAQLTQQDTSPVRVQPHLAVADAQPPSKDTTSITDAQLNQQDISSARRQPHLTTTDTRPPPSDPTPATDPQTQCILFRLPQELRDNIYEHVFGTGVVEGYIQIKDSLAIAPQSALTITCRQIHDEATPLHQAATTTYWAANVFRYTLSLDMNLPVLTTKRVELMTRIILHYDAHSWHSEWDLRSGPWSATGDRRAHLLSVPYRLPSGSPESVSYRLWVTAHDHGKWYFYKATSHSDGNCLGDDICNAQGTFYKQGSVGKGKFDALAGP
jgi:hypothetical protein